MANSFPMPSEHTTHHDSLNITSTTPTPAASDGTTEAGPTAVLKRTSARLAPKPSLLMALTPELFDHVLSFLILSKPEATRLQLGRLLSIHPALAPMIRRRLFKNVRLLIEPATKHQKLTLELIPRLGIHTRYLRIALPELNPSKVPTSDFQKFGAVAGIIPDEKVKQEDAIELVTKVVRECSSLLHLKVEARIGTREQGRHDDEIAVSQERQELEAALVKLDNMDTLLFAVPSRTAALQVLASSPRLPESGDLVEEGGSPWLSPYVPGLLAWTNLTRLDLWRVSLSLPSSTPIPTYRLTTFDLVSSSLGSSHDLRFLLGSNSHRLRQLTLKELDFLSTPGYSDPLLDIFTSTPSFATSLTTLELDLIIPFSSEQDLTEFFYPYQKLSMLHIGGPGISADMFTSLVSTLHTLPLSTLRLSCLHNVPFELILSGSLSRFPSLRKVAIITFADRPRTTILNPILGIPTFEVDKWEWSAKDLNSLIRWSRAVALKRGDPKPVRILRDLTVMDELEDEEDGSSDGSGEDDDESGEDVDFEPTASDLEDWQRMEDWKRTGMDTDQDTDDGF